MLFIYIQVSETRLQFFSNELYGTKLVKIDLFFTPSAIIFTLRLHSSLFMCIHVPSPLPQYISLSTNQTRVSCSVIFRPEQQIAITRLLNMANNSNRPCHLHA